MDNNLYRDWMFTGSPEHRYPETYPVIPLRTVENPQPPSKPALHASGLWCSCVNPLRNGNLNVPLALPAGTAFDAEMLSSEPVRAIFCANGALVCRTEWTVQFLHPQSLQKISEESWLPRASELSICGENVVGFCDTMREYGRSGTPGRSIVVPGGRDHRFLEAMQIEDRLFIHGYLTQAQLPPSMDALGYVRFVPSGEIVAPRDADQPQSIRNSTQISYDNVFNEPIVFLDSVIIIPMRNRLVFAGQDLAILKVLSGDFDRCLVSSGGSDVIYFLAGKESVFKLFVVRHDGTIVHGTALMLSSGIPLCAPLVGTDGTIYCLCQNSIEVFDEWGNRKWSRSFPVDQAHTPNAIVYGTELVVSMGPQITTYSPAGDEVVNFWYFGSVFTTPLVRISESRFIVGSQSGLLALAAK